MVPARTLGSDHARAAMGASPDPNRTWVEHKVQSSHYMLGSMLYLRLR
jgi:hypothetical protein